MKFKMSDIESEQKDIENVTRQMTFIAEKDRALPEILKKSLSYSNEKKKN